jgi:hypothetical protein
MAEGAGLALALFEAVGMHRAGWGDKITYPVGVP